MDSDDGEMRWRIWCGFGLLWMTTNVCAQPLIVEADARDLPRGLLRTRMVFEVEQGRVKLWYPKWIPGVHGPVGPIQNMAGLRVETLGGEPLRWVRDDLLLYQFWVDVPRGERRIAVELDYICNQPSVNSVGVDSYGNSRVGIINWNTCLIYPDGVNVYDYPVKMRLRLPEDWKYGSALRRAGEAGDWVEFEVTSFGEVVDSPLLAGKHVRTFELSPGAQPVFMHVASESAEAIEVPEAYLEKLGKLVSEAEELFGSFPYQEYHFLVGASDQIPTMGLEHLESSLNVVKERDLVEETRRKQRASYLLAHEYVHSWCGKYRRPAGMFTPNYHTDKQTRLLWMYEGLTQYLGEVLAVRSGLISLEEQRQQLADKISRLQHVAGRSWRPLEDTAVVSYHLRGGSKSWGALRRNQDYYNEGLLFWLEADARIRLESGGRRSMDDFCQAFFSTNEREGRVKPYELGEVIATLREIAPFDWEELIQERIFEASEDLALDFISLLGYRLEYSNEPSEYVEARQKYRKYMSALDSLGLEFSEEGKITEIVPGMAGDEAGLVPGMDVEAVNRRKFTKERLQDALAESVTTRKIDLLVLEGDLYREFTIPYDQGPKYLKLERAPQGRDLLRAIFSGE